MAPLRLDRLNPKRFRRFALRYARDDRGVSAILFALILPMLIGMVGIGVEIGYWYAQKRDMQTAADAAALAGAYEIYEGNGVAAMVAAAAAAATENGHTVTRDAENPPWTGAYTADTNAVMAEVGATQAPFFAQVLGLSAFTLAARATARAGTQALGCIVSLSSSASEAVHMSNQGRNYLTNCGLTVNSSAANAVHLENNSQVNGDFARIVGNYDVDQSGTFGSTPVSTGQTTTANPYADLVNPATPGACASGNITTNTTITPGNYCGLNIGSSKNVTMSPGTYYIKDGTFSLGTNSRLYAGAGVTIILTGSAYMDFSSNAYMQIAAPSSGTYAGIALMQDPDGTATTHNMNANVYIGLNGAVYFPNAQLHMDSNSFITTSTVMTAAYATTQPANNSANVGCGLVVTDTLHMDGNSRINLNNDDATCDTGGVPTTTPTPPVLVE